MKQIGENLSDHPKESTFSRLRLSNMFVLSLALIACLAIGFSGFAQFVDTTTTLVSSSDPSYFGQAVEFTATVTCNPPGGSETPSGIVTFYDGVTVLGTADLSDTAVPPAPPVYQATLSVSTLSVGAHAITAMYPGDADTNPSTSDPYYQDVLKAGTTIYILSDTPDPSVLGQSYLVSGTVNTAVDPSIGTPTGTVTVSDGEGNGCQTTIDPVTGDWSCAIHATNATTPTGTVYLSASYGGDGSFQGDTSTFHGTEHEYTDPATRTEIMGAATPLIVNNTATFTVEVVDTSDPLSIPAARWICRFPL